MLIKIWGEYCRKWYIGIIIRIGVRVRVGWLSSQNTTYLLISAHN